MSVLSATAFEHLLECLDSAPEKAAERYEVLRLKLVKILMWKGCAECEADALADAALDRVATKIAVGEQVKNINAYAGEVLRFVWLEHIRRRRETAVGDNLPEVAVEPDIDILSDPDLRLLCLRKCLSETVPDAGDRMLIVGYYDAEAGEKNKNVRKNLAEKLDLSMTTLKVKACRIRNRLEACINECVGRSSVTKTPVSDTRIQGGETQ